MYFLIKPLFISIQNRFQINQHNLSIIIFKLCVLRFIVHFLQDLQIKNFTYCISFICSLIENEVRTSVD